MTSGLNTKPPRVIVVERETEDVYLYGSLEDAAIFVAEFADILEEDFLFFDDSGRRLQFVTSSPSAPPEVRDPSADDTAELNRALAHIAERKGIHWRPGDPLTIFFP